MEYLSFKTSLEDRVMGSDYEIVIVAYMSARLVKGLLSSWPVTVPVCIVDNGRNSDGLAEVVKGFSNARYIPMNSVGFARAANRGASSSSAEFVVFVNPDSRARIEQIEQLVDGMRSDVNAVCYSAIDQFGPRKFCGGGWEPNLGRVFVHCLGLHHIFPMAGMVVFTKRAVDLDFDWVLGTVAAYRRKQLLELGGFDERFYVYSEDMALGRFAREAGLRQVVREDVIIVHDFETSGAPAREMTRIQGASFSFYLDEFHPGLEAVISKVLLAVSFVARAGLARLRGSRRLAGAHMAFVQGIITGRAYVSGEEVAQSRLSEIQTSRNRGSGH